MVLGNGSIGGDPMADLLGESMLIEMPAEPIRARLDGWSAKTLTVDVVRKPR
jgi:hypothetical protein